MNQQQKDDIIMGEMEEDRLIDILNEKWNTNLSKLAPSHTLDFVSGDRSFYVEIKARRNTYNKYPTTMIGYNKVKYIKRWNLSCIFVFAFTDGDYYYTYNDNDEFEVKESGRSDRGKVERQKYIYIPIEKLIKLEV